MGLTENQKQLIQAVSENNMQKAKQCAAACCHEDTTAKNSVFCRKYERMLQTHDNELIELPYDLKKILCVEDSASFQENRYYLSSREHIIYEYIKKMQKVTQQLMELKIHYLNTTLLYGESGSGKTTFGKYVAYKLGMPFCYMNFSQLVDSYMGNTSKNISKVFEFVSNYPCVFMLDEIDCISLSRSGPGESGGASGEMARVTIGLMQEFDKLPSTTVVLAATNRFDRIDKALLRRFSMKHEVVKLSFEERKEMIKNYLDDVGIEFSSLEIERLVRESSNQSDLINGMVRKIAEQLYQKLE